MTEELAVDGGLDFAGFSCSIIFVVDIHSFPGLIRDPPPFLKSQRDPQAGSGREAGSLVRGESIIELGGLRPVF